MPKGIEGRYLLEGADSASAGRPCWVQRVAGERGLYVFAQARKPEEQGFPHVETLLMTLSEDGTLRAYGKKRALAQLGDPLRPGARRPIVWIDGTGVVWAPDDRGA